MEFKFKNKSQKEKIIIWSVVGLIAIIALANFIATSWYSFDVKMSQVFYKAMDYDFFRGWTAYTILDGYIGIITFTLPLGFIIVESFYKWRIKLNPNGKVAKYKNTSIYFYYVLIPIWILYIAYSLAQQVFSDRAFGAGFNEEFLIGWEYLIPIYVVSILFNSTYILVTAWLVKTKLSKHKDFLANRLWEKSFIILLFILICYLPVIIFKSGMGRPYYYNIIWDDFITRVDIKYHDRYVHYMNQNEVNYEWNNGTTNDLPIPGDWPWWKIGKGFFAHNGYYDNLPIEKAFPSGHIAATCGMILTMYLFTGWNSKSKKFNYIKWGFIALGLIYLLDVIFSLQISLSHWWSDITFTLWWAPISFLSSRWIVTKIFEKIESENG